MKRLLFLTLLLSAGSAEAQSPQDLFQQALRLERSQGDLSGAIALYERVAGASGVERSLAVQALYRAGQAHEQLGGDRAEGFYRRITDDYGDQSEIAALAKAALRRLSGPATTEISEGMEWVSQDLRQGGFWGASFSNDGRHFVNTNWDLPGSPLGFQEQGSKEVTYITPQQDSWSYPVFGRFSPDNRRIAYMWFERSDSSTVVKVFDRASRTTKDIFRPDERFGSAAMQQWVELGAWTSDGKYLLITYEVPEGRSIALLDVSSGGLTSAYQTPGYVDASSTCLFEDRYAVFRAEPRSQTELTTMDLRTGEAETLLDAEATILGCSASRGYLAAKLAGLDNTVWLYKIKDGRAQEGPVRIDGVDGDSAIGLGMSDSGTLHFYRMAPQTLQEFSFTDSGQTSTATEPVHYGWTRDLGWSFDGDHFGYLWNIYEGEIRSADGTTRPINLRRYYEFDSEFKRWRRLKLSPDGSHIIAVNAAADGEAATYWIDPDTGVAVDTLRGVYSDIGLSGTRVLSAARKDAETLCVNEHDRGGFQREFLCFADDESVWAPHLRPSGDGTKLMVAATTSGDAAPHLDPAWQSSESWRYSVVDMATGAVEYTKSSATGMGFPSWASNSKGLFEQTETGVRYHPLDGGEPQDYFTELWDVRSRVRPSFHPRENRMMVHSRATGLIDMTEIERVVGVWDLLGDSD